MIDFKKKFIFVIFSRKRRRIGRVEMSGWKIKKTNYKKDVFQKKIYFVIFTYSVSLKG